MAGELVKWSGGQPVEVSPEENKRRVICKALALLRPAPVLPARSRGASAVVPAKPDEIVDFPRVCAVHDRPYAARYIRNCDGLFRRGPMIEVTESLWLRQYAGNGARRLVVPADAIVMAEETCPWCGASGFGAVLCTGCGFEICYGRTAGRYFRCRVSCGHEGKMRQVPRTHEGITPGETRGAVRCDGDFTGGNFAR